MKIRDVMTRDVTSVSPDATIQEAATCMKKIDAGMIPVWDGQKLHGIVTDRDITVRGTAEGHGPGTKVSEVMTKDVCSCGEDDDVQDAAQLMEREQIRRITVLDGGQRLVGVVSLGDLAVSPQAGSVAGEVLERVSQPGPVHH